MYLDFKENQSKRVINQFYERMKGCFKGSAR